MNEKTMRLVVFCIVSAGVVALSYLKQDTTPLLAIATYLMRTPFSGEDK